tara:strand:+ start:744 stop:1466 length:723 start_codon:yes stop_codon:yes gene_type:complete
MVHLVLIRHGQSEWNSQNKFTGWVDIDLSDQGKKEAKTAGELIINENLKFDYYFTSFQKRAINTLKIIQKTMGSENIYFEEAWQLNERHYGALTGLDKEEMKKKLGEKKIHEFRRSWNSRPENLDKNSAYHPLNIKKYKNIPKEYIPNSESLEDTHNRVIPYFKSKILKLLKSNKDVLITAHGNSIRALCKYLLKISNEDISNLEIPTGNPLVINFDKSLKVIKVRYLDGERAKKLLFIN